MKNTRTFLLCLLAAVLAGHFSAQAQTYQQVWADEFNTGISSSWQFETGGGGWGNNEKQYYQAANATVVNGVLQITAKKQTVGGMPYTSARMKTQGLKQFTYGKIEARMKLPLGQGLWPAFWMLGSNIGSVGWPACGEIDIMEHVNTESKVYGTVHWDSNGHAQYGGNVVTTPADYHVYSIEWTPTAIKWFIDGAQYHVIDITNGVGSTEEFQRPFFLLLNLAVAGDWPGQTVDEGKLPATMYVDYVRVYQLTSGGGTAPSSSVQLQAENYSSMSGVQTEATSDAGGGQDVGWIDTGDWMAYNNVSFPTSGAYTVEYRVASPSGGKVSADLNAGAIQLGAVNIPATGGWQTWTTVAQTVNVTAGTYNFGVYAQAGGWNLNWIRITKQGSTAAATAAPGVAALQATTAAPAPTGPLQVDVFPNPHTGGKLTLQLTNYNAAAPTTVRITNSAGAEVWHGAVTEGTLELSQRAQLKNGLYLIQVTNAAQTVVQKLLVQ